jgi:heme a synthase
MDGHRFFRYATIASVVACYVVILIGGNVMASGSGLSCPSWPSCGGTFTPPLNGPAGIEWAHRLSALTLSLIIAVMTLAALLFERNRRPALLRLSGAAAILVVAQALLGGLVVETDLLVVTVLAHLALATALFALLLVLALLANLREIPRPWIEFARRASEELPASEQLARAGGASSEGRTPAPAENRPASPGA